MLQEWSCQECKATLFEESSEPRQPCPVCGCMTRNAVESLKDTVLAFDHMRMKGRHAGESKPHFDARTGASYYRNGGEWHHLYRLIDRENNRYIETIKRLSTGEILSHVDEPLSEHIGHGSAKPRGEPGEP